MALYWYHCELYYDNTTVVVYVISLGGAVKTVFALNVEHFL